MRCFHCISVSPPSPLAPADEKGWHGKPAQSTQVKSGHVGPIDERRQIGFRHRFPEIGIVGIDGVLLDVGAQHAFERSPRLRRKGLKREILSIDFVKISLPSTPSSSRWSDGFVSGE